MKLEKFTILLIIFVYIVQKDFIHLILPIINAINAHSTSNVIKEEIPLISISDIGDQIQALIKFTNAILCLTHVLGVIIAHVFLAIEAFNVLLVFQRKISNILEKACIVVKNVAAFGFI